MSSRPLLGEYMGEEPSRPDEAAKLRKRIAELEAEVSDLRIQVRARGDRLAACEHPMRMLRKELSPLRNAINAIFGELDAAGINEESVRPVAPSSAKSAVWDRWMNQLGGNRAAVLKALLEHGEMSRVQLRVASAVPDGSLNSVTSELHKLGLINRGGGKYSLKEL